VDSAGFLLNDDGRVYMAMNNFGAPPNSYEQYMRVGSWNSITNSMVYLKETSYYGRSASLVRGSGTFASNIYVGGSRDISTSLKWDLAFIRISDPTTALSSTVMRILYEVKNCNAMN